MAKTAVPTARTLREPKVRLRRFKRIKHVKPAVFEPLPSSWNLQKRAYALLWAHKWLFVRISLMYAILTIVLVRGLEGNDLQAYKDSVVAAASGAPDGVLAANIGAIGHLFSGFATTSNAAAGAYQSILAIIVSLAVIWALRQVTAKHHITMRDAYYKGMYPLVPFTVVLLLLVAMLLPVIVGAAVFNTVLTYGIASTGLQILVWLIITIALAILSIRLITAYGMALYVVALPNMRPIESMKSARELVRFRHMQIIRKTVIFAILLGVLCTAIIVPAVIFAASLAYWLFFLLMLIVVVITHAFFYTMYRELVNRAAA